MPKLTFCLNYLAGTYGQPKVKKGFHLACEDVKATRKFVVYGGTDEFPIGNGTVVIALKNLLTTLQEVA